MERLLEIPKEIPKKWAQMAANLLPQDGEIVETKEYSGGIVMLKSTSNLVYNSCPREWLHKPMSEKQKPIPAKEWVKEKGLVWLDYEDMHDVLIKTYEAGEANNKLKHKPTKTMKEALDIWWTGSPTLGVADLFAGGWTECCKSHGWKK